MAEYDLSLLERSLAKWGVSVSEKQENQLIQYYTLLEEWNRVMNLTAIRGWDDVVLKHYVDSLSLLSVFQISTNIDMIDVGTGAGFPGIPLKIFFPDCHITLLDSLKKRLLFLDEVIRRLGLSKIETIHGRAEDFASKSDYRERFDLCVSRAVAPLSVLSELCLPFVKPHGCFVSYKSGSVDGEQREAEYAVRILGGKTEKRVDLTLPYSDLSRSLLLIRKERSTPKSYPRKAGVPSRTPLTEKKTDRKT